ncbi:hypothetical protein KX935_07980 [Streptobacillus moniliformis]|nr:hypothetical protein KX935_07980 [Streptobacillus moniliformis]
MNNERVIFIVEGESDWIYIKKYITELEQNNIKTKKTVRYICSKGKGNLIKKYNVEIKQSKNVVNHYIIVFDVDETTDKQNDEILELVSNSKINNLKLDFIFFNSNIENVFGVSTIDKKKTKISRNFSFQNIIIDSTEFKKENIYEKGSNLYTIIRKILCI